MAHMGRSVKNVEAPRPLKSQSRSSLKNNYMLIEELIQLIESVALSLQSGINNTEPMATLVQNLRIHGPQLETVSKDTLDRAFVVFRNASQDERLNIMTRLNLLELIELRAKGWEDTGINSYYKTKQATNAELNDIQNHVDMTQNAFLSTSPTFGGMNAAGNAAAAAAIAAVGSANQQHLLLSPGEVIRNSGKFPKPTKIPGKTYCKDEVVIRNADSGKVMGIKGRRVHMIEELSETIISFQRVNPGAKERLVQITGPAEDKINYAKQLIEDTIRRNASPVRLDPAMGGGHTGAGGSCSSLNSSNSDEAVQPRTPGASNLNNRLSFNSAQNFMTAAAASQQIIQQQHLANVQGLNSSTPVANAAAAAAAAGKTIRPHTQMLLHSYSTNDASLGEYKFTCNVGQHVIKITGDCCDLVRVAKLVLDDYFSSAEFLASIEAGAAFDGSIVSPISTPTTPMTGAPQFIMGTPLHTASPLATDSGIGLNYISNSNNNQDGDDDVFVDGNNLSKSASQSNGLARSRRSHFSRKDSTPEAQAPQSTLVRQKSEVGHTVVNNNIDGTRVIHQYEQMLYYAQSPHSWALPNEWQKICEKFPAIIRNKVKPTHAFYNSVVVASIATTTNSATTISTSLGASTPPTTTTTITIPSTTTTTASTITYSPKSSNIKACNNSLTLRVACNNAAAHLSTISTTSAITNTSTPTTTFTTTANNNNNNTITTNNIYTSSEIKREPIDRNNLVAAANNVVHNNISISFKNLNNNTNNNNNQVFYDTELNEKLFERNAMNNASTFKTNPFVSSNLSLNIKRKGFFNRLTYSIDEEGGYEALAKPPFSNVETVTNVCNASPASAAPQTAAATGGSGRLNNVNLNRQLISIRTGPMTCSPMSLPSPDNFNETGTAQESKSHQKLLHKQMKIISDIMVESSKTGNNNNKSQESLKSLNDAPIIKKHSEEDTESDDNDVEIVAVSAGTGAGPQQNVNETCSANASGASSSSTTTTNRPKLSYEFRSYSTCD